MFAFLIFGCTKTTVENYDWEVISFPNHIDLQCIQMMDDNTGFVAGFPEYEYSVTMGIDSESPYFNTDTLIIEPDTIFIKREIHRTSIKNTGYFLFKTIDGGTTWMGISTPFESGIKGLFFLNENFGYVATRYEGVFKTTDGGNFWEKILRNVVYEGVSLGSPDPYDGILFLDENNGFVFRTYPPLLVISTHDGGKTWSNASNNFINQQTGSIPEAIIELLLPKYSSDTLFCNTPNGLFRTVDKGNSWQKILDGASDISFLNSQVGFATGYPVMKTLDGGTPWSGLNVRKLEDNFIAVSPDDFFTADFVGFNSFKLSDSGEKFVPLTCKSSYFINDWVFPSKKCAYAVGSDGLVLKYTSNN
jgi:hypothetical protein